MNRCLVVIIYGGCLLGFALQAGAQGTVTFGGAIVTTNRFSTGANGKISPSSNYHFGLYVGATATEAELSTTPVLVVTPAANAFPGQIGSDIQTVFGHSPGETLFFVVKGWDGNAPTYETSGNDPRNLVGGVSHVGEMTTGLGGGSAPPFFLFTGIGGIGANDLVLTSIPEPSALVLSSLAFTACALHARHRKSCGSKNRHLFRTWP